MNIPNRLKALATTLIVATSGCTNNENKHVFTEGMQAARIVTAEICRMKPEQLTDEYIKNTLKKVIPISLFKGV
jgi:hypothetical protein